MHQKPKKLKNVKWNKNFGCPGRISFFAFFNTYMYLVSKNISPGLREFLVNQCLVSQGVTHPPPNTLKGEKEELQMGSTSRLGLASEFDTFSAPLKFWLDSSSQAQLM